ncbi:MAG: hypothetical protein KDB80_13295 [Planctomycetes bacterium]|nr:hypothetical protein [Planctomycetota bacterium]
MLIAHLWKEWREQRLVIGVLAASMLLLAVAYGALAPRKYVPGDVTVWFAILGLGAGYFVLVTELVPGEFRRRQITFLVRTPKALRHAWMAKLLTMFGGLASLAGLAFVCGSVCLGVAGVDAVQGVRTLGTVTDRVAVSWIVAALAIVACWSFTVSCWCGNGIASIGLTILLGGGVVAPVILVLASYHPPTSPGMLTNALWCCFVGGVVASGLSLVRGLKHGGRRRAFAVGSPVLFAFLLPAASWCVDRSMAFHDAKWTDESLRVRGGYLSDDGRRAFLTFTRWGMPLPSYSVVLDLETGDWQQVGGARSMWASVGLLKGQPWLSTGSTARYVVRVADLYSSTGEAWELHDTLDGAVESVHERTIPAGMDATFLRFAWEKASITLPNGTRVCVVGDRAWFVPTDGAPESIALGLGGDTTRVGWPSGYGFRVRSTDERNLFFDATRRKVLAAPREHVEVYVRAGEWVISRRHGAVSLFDPDSGTIREWNGLPNDARRLGIMRDGRLVFELDGRLEFVDPGGDERAAIEVDGVDIAEIRGIHHYLGGPDYGVGDDQVLCVTLQRATRISRAFARLHGSKLEVGARFAWSASLVGVLDNGEYVIIHNDRTVERCRFGSPDSEVILRFGPPMANERERER